MHELVARAGEEVLAHAREPLEVVHVARELGDGRRGAGRRARSRRRARLAASRAASAAASPAVRATRRAEVVAELGAPATPAQVVPGSARQLGRTRLTTTPPNGSPCSRSRRWKKIVSSTGSRSERGDEQEGRRGVRAAAP